MPRKHLIITTELPYHVYNRSNNKDFFYIKTELLWKICLTVFDSMIQLYGVKIHAFVLMNNHYHLILSTPLGNLSDAMAYFHREVAKKSNKVSGRVNHFFGGRYKWCVIGSEDYFWNAIKYIFRNPVSAGICEAVESYKFSSLNSSSQKFSWNMINTFSIHSEPLELDLSWLNKSFDQDQSKSIYKALRRREFKLPTNSSGKQTRLETPQRKKELGTF